MIQTTLKKTGLILFSLVSLLQSNLLYSYIDYRDTTFGPNKTGIVTTHLDFSSILNGLAVGPNGKSVAVGATNINSVQNYVIARYNTDGTLDTTFNSSGSQPGVVKSLGGFDTANLNAVAIDSSNNIYATGTYNSNQILLVKYTSTGALDSSFAGGIVTLSLGDGANSTAILIDSNGKIIIAGTAIVNGQANVFVARYNTNGTLDTSFNTTGYNLVTGSSHFSGTSAKIDNNGKILVGGNAQGISGADFLLVRFNSTDGLVDTSFNGTGIVTTPISSSNNDSIQGLAITSGNQIVAAGYVLDNNNNTSIALAKYNSDGSIDTSFGANSDGIVIQSIGTSSQANATLIGLAGNIFVGGTSDNQFLVARFTPNGSLDTSFGIGGYIITTLDKYFSPVNALAVQASDGRVIAGGYTTTDNSTGDTDFALVRYNKNNTDFINVTSIPDYGSINTKIPTLSGTSSATAGATVNVYLNGALAATTTTDSSGNWNAGNSQVLPVGSNTIQVDLVVSSVVVVSHATKFTVKDNFSEDSLFACNTTAQTKSSTGFSSVPFDNRIITGTWTYASNVFTCKVSGRYEFTYVGFPGVTSISTATAVVISTMVAIDGTEYIGSEANTNVDLGTNTNRIITKSFVKDLTANQTVAFNYAINGNTGTPTGGLLVNALSTGTQHAYSLAITRVG